MPCFSPLKGYRSKTLTKNGKRKIVFDSRKAHDDETVTLPCRQCIGCRLEYSRQWAIRCVHEASLYNRNCFITLTYNNDNLPDDGSLNVRHFQLFMKRLRKKYGTNIRFFHCGEYGDLHRRPHYHACLFNLDFADKKLWKITNTGDRLYTSEELSKIWPYGFCTIGDVTFKSAAYVARYITKKIYGELAKEHYTVIDDDGVVTELKHEYTTMSRRPGIAKGWLDKYGGDVYPDDFVIMNGKKMKPPKYYDNQFEIEHPLEFDDVKDKRLDKAAKHFDNNTYERLAVREQVLLSKIKKLKRTVDKEN
ncbi:replication initiator protein [Microviridae sp.]|nr:replication initiator protein [Microviridae sp.]